MGRGSCTLALADLFTWIAVIVSIVALFAPFWYSVGDPPLVSSGLFMKCDDPYHQNIIKTACEFIDVAPSQNPDWLTSVRCLWAGGTFLLFIVGIVSFCLCCDSCRKASCSGLVFLFVFLAAAALSVAVILFGVYGDDKMGYKFDRSTAIYFDWGFYCAIIAAGSAVLACFLFGCVICVIRSE